MNDFVEFHRIGCTDFINVLMQIWIYLQDDYDEWDFGFSADNERSIQHGVQKTAQNLKVTVVPDVTLNACLNGETFDATLPPDVKEWFNHLKQSWTSCKSLLLFILSIAVCMDSETE